MSKKRIIVAITGASGAVFGVRLLQLLLGKEEVETHLVVSKAGGLTLSAECNLAVRDVEALADQVHHAGNVGASISSGSFKTDGMIVVPCSMKTAAAIATGVTAELVSRAADVCLKERRRLVLAVRETPLHQGHLENLLKLSQMGAIIYPLCPAFYHKPRSIDDIVEQSCMRLLDQIGIELETAPRWGEEKGVPAIGDLR